MAAVKTIGGSIANTGGVPLPSKTVTLKNDDTGATITTTTTNADGEWEFANRDETVRYRAEAAFGGSSSQVVVRKPASAEFDHLYANLSLRSAAGATVALGGALTVAGGLAVTGNLSATGNLTINGDATINGTIGSNFLSVNQDVTVTGELAVGGDVTLGGAVLLGSGSGIALAFVGDADTGLVWDSANQFSVRNAGTDTVTFSTGETEVWNGLSVTGDLDVTGIIHANVAGGDAGINGSGTLYSNVGGLSITSTVASSLGGSLTVAGTLAASGAATVGTTLTVNSRPVIMAGCRVYHNANQAVATGTTAVVLAFNSERFDTDAFHDTVTNNSRLTVPAGLGGTYQMTGHVEWQANADANERQLAILVNGATTIAVASQPAINSGTTVTKQTITVSYVLAAGDYVTLNARQQSGVSLTVNTSSNYSPEFSMQRIG